MVNNTDSNLGKAIRNYQESIKKVLNAVFRQELKNSIIVIEKQTRDVLKLTLNLV